MYVVDENNSAGWILYYNDTATNVGMSDKKVVIKGNQVHLNNNTAIYSKNPDGETRGLAIINSSNYTVYGYGSYDNNEGYVYYRGNNIGIHSKSSINITSPTAGLSNRAYGVNKILWSGAWVMSENHTATLIEPISKQPHGAVLVWVAYNNGVAYCDFSYSFIPKWHVNAAPGCGITTFMASSNMEARSTKYVYANDTTIKGYYNNEDGETADIGFGQTPNYWVLFQVIGV